MSRQEPISLADFRYGRKGNPIFLRQAPAKIVLTVTKRGVVLIDMLTNFQELPLADTEKLFCRLRLPLRGSPTQTATTASAG